ncbi:MAG TPA: response regulator, partial [Thermoanaerobaculia bacterium]|nr:response regulator [Thermoanaerobaculia bacterium]
STFSIRLPAVPRAVTPGDRVAGVFVPLDGALPAVEQMLAEEGYIVSRLLTPGEVLAAVRSGHLSILIMSLDAQPAATLLLSQVRAADTRGDTPVIVLASSSQSIEWLSDNLTVFLSGAGDLDLLHAIRKFAGETANNDVLIIEDDEALLSILRRQLESEGMQVRTATTGGAAIAMIRRAAPTLIVLDVRLPDIDGFDVVSMLHREERFRRLPLLVYSGLSLGSRERERLTLGPTRFLTKATSDDAAFRKLVGELIRSVRAEHAP